VRALFVYADGQVGMLDTPFGDNPSICFPRPMNLSVNFNTTETAPDPLSIDYDEYFQRGKTFAGIPVFCARMYDVKTAALSLLVPTSEQEDSLQRARGEVRRFVRREPGHTIELDERHECLELQDQWIVNVRVELLVAKEKL
jgi:hypothetical protein